MAGPRLFNFKSHIISFGPAILSEFADADDVVKAEPGSDVYDLIMGADNKGTRVRINDTSAKLEVVLAYTSPLNQVLTGFLQADIATPNGVSIFPFIIKDLLGSTLHMAQTAWIKAWPKDSIGKSKPGPRTWMFDTDSMLWNFGGS